MIQKPWLCIPSEWGHAVSPLFFKIYGKLRPYKTLTWKPFSWKGLHFTNPLGLAGGFDKNAELIESFWSLGVGFMEVGTVTPLPQKQNPGKVIGRSIEHTALWNQLGFPSDGVEAVVRNLKKIRQPHFTPLFVNIGKNRSTPLEEASKDYVYLIQKLSPYADTFVVNVSSPNTPQLRDLLKPNNLKNFLSPILQENKKTLGKPVLLKISPDIEIQALKQILDTSAELGIDGWILTNTTLDRQPGLKFPDAGGVSGSPLKEKSKKCLQETIQHLGADKSKFLVVSVGGIMTAGDVEERLSMGADLVQVYSTLIFEGPFFFKKVAQQNL